MRAGVADDYSLTLTRGSPCSGTKWVIRALLRVFKPPEEYVRQSRLIRSDVWIWTNRKRWRLAFETLGRRPNRKKRIGNTPERGSKNEKTDV
jgi:hypothetical protein